MRVTDRIEDIDGTPMYRISNVDQMDPFLMTIVSDTDLWMFVSSSGGLTAGRVEPANCLFPYETDDRLHEAGGRIGPVTVLQIRNHDGTTLWEPFQGDSPHTRRHLFKSLLGNTVIFEEEHLGLGLVFRYRWAPSDRFGWVRTSWLTNEETHTGLSVDILDGVRGIMPWGIGVSLQQQMSNLANAYRRSEIVAPGIGLFALEALISDRPEPAEALRATTVWSTGLADPGSSVDPAAIASARDRHPFHESHLLTGRPGAFLVHDRVDLEPGQSHRWHIVADVGQSHADVSELRAFLASGDDLAEQLDANIDRSRGELWNLIAASDGFHSTGSPKNDAHHLANTLFNVMRGGTFIDGYSVERDRFREFVTDRNREVASRHGGWLESLPEVTTIGDLRDRAREVGDAGLTRLAHEYLPIGFSRRHGDPSRPWNHFEIRVRDRQGEPLLSYQGNWRDIFQNWEALCVSFPEALPSIVAKFVNASTVDGFNPYRLTSEGVDWEIPDPDDPWSGIGYWGDHQIVYLLRLLEAMEAFYPGSLHAHLSRIEYTFADVPYRIVPYDQLVQNPKSTVDYDRAAEEAIARRVSALGADGKLVADADDAVIHVTFLEKLLVPMLAKISNYVPQGGIWMNTERPEWNDANNALVGYGLSMVTLFYLRRFVALVDELASGASESLPVSPEVIAWMDAVTRALETNSEILEGSVIDPQDRARLTHQLGTAYDIYRSAVYQHGPSQPQPLEPGIVQRLCRAALPHLDHTIRSARRPDGLYHAYNLVRFSPDGTTAEVDHLPEMLEGQVAAISTGLLNAADVTAVLKAMYESALYREDVDSFILYPAKALPSFGERNLVPTEQVEANPLLNALLDRGSDEVIVRDIEGRYHFNPDLRNANDLAAKLDRLTDETIEPLAKEHATATLQLFEEVFHHHAFTGRSSSMYAYEGIGSVYWHMVAKLLVALQESVLRSRKSKSRDELIGMYLRVRRGLGFNKTADDYGAFPTDPYSHTPAHAGAQQPGMTGQVKEEMLTRWAELGLTVTDGSIRFTPILVNEAELRSEPGPLLYRDVGGNPVELALDAGSFGFTVCQVPVVIRAAGGEPRVVVTGADNTEREVAGLTLDWAASREIFGRTGNVQRLDVFIPPESLRSESEE